MAEELAFARKASGLTRGLSMYDAFGMGLINILPLYAIWFMFMAGLGIFAHANLFIAVAITAVTLGIASPIVWGVMAGSMPRSGGDYVYNSRIIHPIVGMAASFGMVLGQMYWNIYMATWITDFFLVPLGQFMGWPGLVTFAETKWATFLFSVLLFATAFCIVAFGMSIFRKIQRPIVVITLITTTACFIPLLLVSKATFAANWNAAAAKYDSLDYASFVKAVEAASGAAFTGGWTWHDTIGAFTATFMLVVYSYIIAYVGGEIKRPDKSIMGANFLGGGVTVALAFLFLFGAYHAAESRFLISAAFNEFNGGVEGYNLPWSSGVMGLVFTASGFNRVVGAAMALTWLLSTVAIFAVILTFVQRVIFAWGMDRMGPKWFTDISPRYATPMKGFLFVTIVSAAFSGAYILWLQSALAGLVAAGMMTVSVFLTTAISAIIFPFRKRVKSIWDSSPFSNWKLLGVPVITIAGVVYLVYILILLYFAFVAPETRDLTGKNLFVFAAIWALGVVWYFFWRHRSLQHHIDVSMTFEELPPE